MQKILDLLGKAGCKQELIQAIGTSLEEYKTTVREQYEADFTAKINQAKKVCIEETDAHKRELARRLQIFLETKNAAIEAHLARQSALSESEAMAKLKSLKALLEGVELNSSAENGPATTGIIEKAKLKIQQLTEERDQANETANRRNAISEKVLRRNRELVSENAKLRSQQGNGGPRQPVNEGRTRGNQPQRIDGSRQSSRPTTTRSTIVENQTRRPPTTNGQGNVKTQGSKNGTTVNDIAEGMDEDLI